MEPDSLDKATMKEYVSLAKKALKVMKDNMDKIKTKQEEMVMLDIEEGVVTQESWEELDGDLLDF